MKKKIIVYALILASISSTYTMEKDDLRNSSSIDKKKSKRKKAKERLKRAGSTIRKRFLSIGRKRRHSFSSLRQPDLEELTGIKNKTQNNRKTSLANSDITQEKTTQNDDSFPGAPGGTFNAKTITTIRSKKEQKKITSHFTDPKYLNEVHQLAKGYKKKSGHYTLKKLEEKIVHQSLKEKGAVPRPKYGSFETSMQKKEQPKQKTITSTNSAENQPQLRKSLHSRFITLSIIVACSSLSGLCGWYGKTYYDNSKRQSGKFGFLIPKKK